MELVPIGQFYKNKNIFITGATGFLGKMLIEKLLRSVPDIGDIYVLVRPKKGKVLQERIDHMLTDPLYDVLKSTKNADSVFSKIKPIAGDCSELNLGISSTDYEILTSNVNIVFHMAASVRFDDPLKKAILLNTRGTREIVSLCEKITNLHCFVHVSTTYCNCVVGKEIDEKLYPPPGDWRQMIEIAEKFDSQALPLLTDKILGEYPNTYTFTKALAEHVVNDLCIGKFPTIICRPSIVISALDDPIKGWIDNFNGPAGLLIASGKGLVRCMYMENDCCQDYMPVDCLIKGLITAAWDTFHKKDLTRVEVVNCCSGKDYKPITLGTMLETCKVINKVYPLDNALWIPKGSTTNSKFYAYFCCVFFHLVPYLFIDGILKLVGHKAFLSRLFTKIFIAAYTLRYFVREWDFVNDKFIKLHESLMDQDKEEWGFDARNIDVEDFMKTCILGGRRFLLNEKDEDLPKARKHFIRMYWVDKVAMFILYSSFIYILYSFKVHIILFNYICNKFYYYVNRPLL